jgi:alpha-beta hydrolase superfamily lysophospholipase
MESQETTFQSADGLQLQRYTWLPQGEPKALVAVVHGFGEHGRRYGNLVEALLPRGFAVASYDLRGHGRSPGPRGLILSWDEYRQDTQTFLELLGAEHPRPPLFLYGHSMGGLIALDYAIRRPEGLGGVIASAPAVGKPGISPFLLLLSRILSKVWPRLSLPTKLDATAISRDPQVVEAYQQDPLVHDLGTPRLGTELAKTADWVQEHAPQLKLPLLVLQGEADRLVMPQDTRRFFDNAGSQDKTYHLVPGGFHEPHNDLDWRQTLEVVAGWLEARL